MKSCPSCNTGKLELSGAHLYCNKCSYSQFVANNDYIDACAVVVGSLLSNTAFSNDRGVMEVVERYIYMHLPQLYSFMQSLAQGQQTFLKNFTEASKTQAINLQVGVHIHNKEEKARDLRCQCGSDTFNMVKVGELVCDHCDAKYEYDEDDGSYQPYFLCKCGQATYEEIDEPGLIACKGCGSLHLHDSKNKIFRRVQ